MDAFAAGCSRGFYLSSTTGCTACESGQLLSAGGNTTACAYYGLIGYYLDSIGTSMGAITPYSRDAVPTITSAPTWSSNGNFIDGMQPVTAAGITGQGYGM